MTTQLDIQISKIKPHPNNVRRDAIADEEMVASVREKGVLQPVAVVPNGATYLLIAGHRRVDAAKKAKLKDVPAIVHDHLDTPESQIEAMLVENGRRSDLTPVEEARAYEQLTLLGLDEKEISKRTGRSVATVKQRLQLRRLSDQAEQALHGAQISLVDAGHMIELEEHPELLEEVAQTIGTDDFNHALRRAVDVAGTLAEHERLRDEYRALGLPEVKRPKNGWDYMRGPRELYNDHDRDKADAWYVGIPGDASYAGKPRLIQTKVTQPKKTAEEEKRAAEYAALEAKRRDEQKEVHLAQQMRIEHVAEMAPGLKVPKPLMAHLRVAAAELLADQDAASIEQIIAATGLPLERIKNDEYPNRRIAAQVHALPGPQALTVLLCCLGSVATRALSTGYSSTLTEATCTNITAYWASFETSEYPLPKVDKKARDNHLDRVARTLADLEKDAE